MGILGFTWALAKEAPSTALARRRRGPLRPTWSFAFENLAATLRGFFREAMALPPAQMRAFWEAQAAPNPAFAQVRRERVDVCAIPGEWFTPRAGYDGTMLYLHGGAYVYGSARTHAELVSRLAVASRARALLLEYRLAPEHPLPAGLNDALAAYRSLLSSGTPPEELVVAGDSAGGGLAAALLCALRDAGEPLPAGAALICPWVDLFAQDPGMRENSGVDWGEAEYFPKLATLYVGREDTKDPRASPVHADLAGLPPLLVQVGSAELLRDQVRAFAERAKAAGVDVRLELWPDMIHAWHLWASIFEASRRAIDQVAEFARRRILDARDAARRKRAS